MSAISAPVAGPGMAHTVMRQPKLSEANKLSTLSVGQQLVDEGCACWR